MPIATTAAGKRFCFLHGNTEKSLPAYNALTKLYGQNSVADSDIIVTLGGDGFLLQVLGNREAYGKPVFGMNRGSVGFLLNSYRIRDLPERLDSALSINLRRLRARVSTGAGDSIKATAVNDIALFRETGQAAHLAITINGITRLEELVCDGILLATPAGSTAYNLSAQGPILPLRSNLLAMTPISAFRPRRWPGALLDKSSTVRFDVIDPVKRPVALTADSRDIRGVTTVEIDSDPRFRMTLLFESGNALDERILREQFVIP